MAFNFTRKITRVNFCSFLFNIGDRIILPVTRAHIWSQRTARDWQTLSLHTRGKRNVNVPPVSRDVVSYALLVCIQIRMNWGSGLNFQHSALVIFRTVGFEIFVCNRQSVILSLARCLVIQVLNLCYYHQFYWISNFVLPSQDDLTPLHREEGRQIRVWEPERLYPGLQETKHVEFVTESEQYICPCRGAVMCSQGKPKTKIITHVIPFAWVLLIWGYRFSAGDT